MSFLKKSDIEDLYFEKSNFKEIQDLLSITMDLSIKEKSNKQKKNNKKV